MEGKKKMMKKLLVAFLFCSLLFFVSSVFAHDGAWGDVNDPLAIDWIGDSQTLDLEHQDADPWKGWASLIVWNICGDDWGDFHLKIKGINIDNVDFVANETYIPQMWIRVGGTWVLNDSLSWTINNTVVGAEMDLFFYDDPIEHGDIAKFRVYTDNTASHCSLFYVSAHPTPVPEPTMLALLSIGILALRRKK